MLYSALNTHLAIFSNFSLFYVADEQKKNGTAEGENWKECEREKAIYRLNIPDVIPHPCYIHQFNELTLV